MTIDYAEPLRVAVEAALAAGALLRAEFHRPGGPRGEHGHADVDDEAEHLIRDRLLGAFPHWGYRGEETGFQPPPPGLSPTHLWLVDPQDGTRAFLQGFRGCAVSIGLLREETPVLGVVYAFSAPDDDGDLFTWAEGTGPLRRNGRPVVREPWPPAMGPHDVVLASRHANRAVMANLRCGAPGRFWSLSSIAYRMALVAAGEGTVAASRSGPGSWDYAAGHALLRAAGGEFVDERGQPVRYTADGLSQTVACFGGAPGAIKALADCPWRELLAAESGWTEPAFPAEYAPVRLEPGRTIADPGLLRRAQGCLLGQLAGDSLGSLVEFQSPERILRAYPQGVRRLENGGTWDTLAGQPTDDSELALLLARTLVREGEYDAEAAARAYAYWLGSEPFDIGGTTHRALVAITPADVARGSAAEAARRAASGVSQANGSLMRSSPLGIWGYARDLDDLAERARADSLLTHPHPICQEACATFVVAMASAVATGAEAPAVYRDTLAWAEKRCREPAVLQALRAASQAPPASYTHQQGWVLIAFQNAFYQLLHAPSLEEGVVRTVMAGGDTDTNAAIAGSLLGAVHGREAVPAQWRLLIVTCHALAGAPGVRRPRPRPFWPVDALELAERLLLAGRG